MTATLHSLPRRTPHNTWGGNLADDDSVALPDAMPLETSWPWGKRGRPSDRASPNSGAATHEERSQEMKDDSERHAENSGESDLWESFRLHSCCAVCL